MRPEASTIPRKKPTGIPTSVYVLAFAAEYMQCLTACLTTAPRGLLARGAAASPQGSGPFGFDYQNA